MKKTRNLISICIILAMVLCCALTGCDTGSGNKATAAQVTDLAFNYDTGAFTFSDVKADEYKVRVFPAEVAEGEADMPITQLIVPDNDTATYSGTLDVTTMDPGKQYKVVVYSFVNNADGTQSSAISNAVIGAHKYTYETPNNNTQGVSCTILDNEITVTLSGAFFSGNYGKCAPSFQIKLFKNGELLETKVLKDEDMDIVTTESTDSSGNVTTSTEGKGEAKFTIDDPTAAYTVTLKVISTDDVAFFDSEEGSAFNVTEYVEAPEGDAGTGDAGTGDAGTGTDDSAGSENGENSEGGENTGSEPAGSEPAGDATTGTESADGEMNS